MRHLAHKTAWGMAAVLAVTVVLVRHVDEGLDPGWLVRAGLIVAISSLVAIGVYLRDRAMDEEIALELLAAKGLRLYRETDGLSE